jgi:hypothetical protein
MFAYTTKFSGTFMYISSMIIILTFKHAILNEDTSTYLVLTRL